MLNIIMQKHERINNNNNDVYRCICILHIKDSYKSINLSLAGSILFFFVLF